MAFDPSLPKFAECPWMEHEVLWSRVRAAAEALFYHLLILSFHFSLRNTIDEGYMAPRSNLTMKTSLAHAPKQLRKPKSNCPNVHYKTAIKSITELTPRKKRRKRKKSKFSRSMRNKNKGFDFSSFSRAGAIWKRISNYIEGMKRIDDIVQNVKLN